MTQLYSNNGQSTLLAAITNVATSLQVAAGEGALFPNPTAPDFFLATLYKVVGGVEMSWEIVKVTARAGDVFTVVRGQEGTTAIAYAAGDRVSLRVTAGSQVAVLGSTGIGLGQATTTVAGLTLTAPVVNGGVVGGSVGISAAGVNQAGATALTQDFNRVTTVAVGAGVVLATPALGRTQIVLNKGANALLVYPPSGAAIDALATNAAISLPVNGRLEFMGASATLWDSSINMAVNTSALVGSLGAGWTLIPASTVTASGAATMDVEWANGTYDQFVIVFSGVTVATDSVNVSLRFKVGGAYDTGSNYLYQVMNVDSGNSGYFGTGTSGTPAAQGVFAPSAGNTAGKALDLMVFVHNPQSTSLQKRVDVQGSFIKSNGNITTSNGVIQNSSTSAMTGVRLFASSGNVSGTSRLYGIANS